MKHRKCKNYFSLNIGFFKVMPHNHRKKIAKFYYADQSLIQKAIIVATEAQKEWDQTPISER